MPSSSQDSDVLTVKDVVNLSVLERSNSVTFTSSADVINLAATRRFRGNTYQITRARRAGITLAGNEKNDWLEALGGNNTITTGEGKNVVLADVRFRNIWQPYAFPIREDFIFWTQITGLGINTITCGDDDDYVAAGGAATTVNLGDGNNTYDSLSSDSRDNISAGDGNDTILTLQTVVSGISFPKAINDRVFAGDGNNIVFTGIGDDKIVAGDGNDIIFSSSGKDKIEAGNGRNILSTGRGLIVSTAQMSAGSGNDFIIAEAPAGRARIRAGDGNNQVIVVAANSVLACGDGDDEIIAGIGNDVIKTGDGRNTVNLKFKTVRIPSLRSNSSTLGGGEDKVYLGDDRDLIILKEGTGDATIYDYQSQDSLKVRGISGVTLVQQGSNVIVRSDSDTLIATLIGTQASSVTLIQ